MDGTRKSRRLSGVEERLLECLVADADRLVVLGDFAEEFERLTAQHGLWRARAWYWGQILKSSPSFFIRSTYFLGLMFKNYAKIAVRTLWKRKVFSMINLAGLGIGIAASLLLLKYVSFERSYDAFHENADALYRLTNDRYQNGDLTQHGVITYPSAPKAMKADYPEVLDYARLLYSRRQYVQHGALGFEEPILYADSAFFGMFSFPLRVGDASTVLAAPNTMALSETLAAKYFGADWAQQQILGEPFTLNNTQVYTITGVFEDVPAASHMRFEMVASYATLSPASQDSWTNSNFMAYLRLAPGTDPTVLEGKLLDFSDRYFRGNEVTGSVERFFLQPLSAIHLYSDYEYETWTHGNGRAVWTLLIIAWFILLIAWINYINLSTARALERAKEVGVRKVMGARKTQLIRQFLFESAFLNAAGLLIALLIVRAAQPLLNQLLGLQFSASFLPSTLGLLFAAFLLLGMLLSGLYPAFLLSSYHPVSILKGRFSHSGQGVLLRKGLVVFQFALSFALIVGTYAVYSQVEYMLDKDLGINIDQTLVMPGPYLASFDSTYFDNISNFKQELVRYETIEGAATSVRLPGTRTGRILALKRQSDPEDRTYTASDIGVDSDFFTTFDMDILAGRGFDSADHNLAFDALTAVVLNETATQFLGFETAQDALHEKLNYWNKEWEIIGVVSDHHHQSLHVPVEPTVFMPLYSTGSFFFFKVQPERVAEALATVERTYATFFPGNAFTYFFLDERFNEQYQADRHFRTSLGLFSSLGILLACLGLFGLSLSSVVQRTKEIGIRKVLGATTNSIMVLLMSEFLKLVALAALLVAPLTYWLLQQWLTTYAYRIEVSWLLFAAPVFLMLLIAALTVSFHSGKAALANPADTLRSE